MPKAWADLGWWIKNDLKTVRKIYELLENCQRTPFEGIGKPEPLKGNYSGYWSRRITGEHRIIYKAESERIIIHSMHGHYQD
jgi:toxin YoeB